MDVDPRNHIISLADQCVMCGLCLPHCPTYALDAQEAESPRGRIAMAAALAKGTATPEPALRLHLDHCLGCMGCEKVCPANVQFGELLVQTRALIGPSPGRPRLLLGVLKRPAWLRATQALVRGSGMARLLPALARRLPPSSAWRAALATLPRAQKPATLKTVSAPTNDRGHVAIFPGCVASVEDADAQVAAQSLLRAAGFKVTVLPAFCCGAMDAHGGLAKAAEDAALQVRQAWTRANADILVSVTPGCLGTLRRALPGVKVQDAVGLIAAHADALRFAPLKQRAALHVPCTQANVARTGDALRGLLLRVANLDVRTLPAAPQCCGAAGTHMLEYPERAAILRDARLGQVAALAPDLLLSSNIGCRLHLAAGMSEGKTLPTLHPLTLLAQQLESS
jgi:glycolate oxidase iron-sulfur subunit